MCVMRRQVSMEVHDVAEPDGASGRRIDDILSLLERKGFAEVSSRQDERMAGTNLWMLYAKR